MGEAYDFEVKNNFDTINRTICVKYINYVL